MNYEIQYIEKDGSDGDTYLKAANIDEALAKFKLKNEGEYLKITGVYEI